MSIRDRIITVLKNHPDGLDDDELAETLGLSQREQANSRCRQLAVEGLVERRSVGGKIRTFWTDAALAPVAGNDTVSDAPTAVATKPWCWEGNVVRAVVSHLTENGWAIDSIANTATGAPGADIKATRSGDVLVIEVKGYPSKLYERGAKIGLPKRTNPPTQARHWFGEAILTALLRQTDPQTTQVAIAFPDFEVYTRLLTRISQSVKKLGLMVLIVNDAGVVKVVQDGSRISRP